MMEEIKLVHDHYRMFAVPGNQSSLSLRLSKVLSNIGVNERIVTDRRMMRLLSETIENISSSVHQLMPKTHYFGSQTEGTTTRGLQADTDQLFERNIIKVIQDISESNPYEMQLQMLQDETIAPGYCLLQRLDSFIPCPWQLCMDVDGTVQNTGRMFFKNSSLYSGTDDPFVYRRGPAIIFNRDDHDTVLALSCSSWPVEAIPWLQKDSANGWPTAEMKQYSAAKGCYVVPVASRTSLYPELEWRISTSHAERCLMFSLNITQLRCYVLLKMIIKTYVEPTCHDAISSYLLKNILFYCIACSHASFWKDHTLVTCLSQCLRALFHCILVESCPHFIIPSNNLLKGRLTDKIRQQLIETMCSLTENIEQTLLGISTDNLGESLKLSVILPGLYLAASDTEDQIQMELCRSVSSSLMCSLRVTQQWLCNHTSSNVYRELSQKLFGLLQIYSRGSWLCRTACKLYAPFFCTIIGSAVASEDIEHSRPLSQIALEWFTLGLNSDCVTNMLKVASALLCSGDLNKCETILTAVGTQLNGLNFMSMSICSCDSTTVKPEFGGLCCDRREKMVKTGVSVIVTYMPFEKHSAPEELVFEMFKCNQGALSNRDSFINWMDLVEVDSVPYFYFLKYKVYSQLQMPAAQKEALENLSRTTETEPLLYRRETAYNLLGQCLEQENRHKEALHCYNESLRVNSSYNVAAWHISRLTNGRHKTSR